MVLLIKRYAAEDRNPTSGAPEKSEEAAGSQSYMFFSMMVSMMFEAASQALQHISMRS